MNVVSIFTLICWYPSYDLILGCTTYCDAWYEYFLYMLCYAVFTVVVNLYLQQWINISLFELVVICIEPHILVPNFSISHIFPSVIKCFCCFSLLGRLFTSNIQHSKTCIQHHFYTIFEKISSVSCLVFIHT